MTWSLPPAPSFADIANDAGGHTGNDRKRGDVFRENCARAHQCAFANSDARQDRRVAPNRGVVPDVRLDHLPIRLRLQAAIGIYGSGVQIVNEHNAMPDENTVAYRDAGANKSVAGDLAIRADLRITLYFNESADLGSVTDRAAVQVYQVRLEDLHIAAQHNIDGDHWLPAK